VSISAEPAHLLRLEPVPPHAITGPTTGERATTRPAELAGHPARAEHAEELPALASDEVHAAGIPRGVEDSDQLPRGRVPHGLRGRDPEARRGPEARRQESTPHDRQLPATQLILLHAFAEKQHGRGHQGGVMVGMRLAQPPER
jgi:hypothetical protein